MSETFRGGVDPAAAPAPVAGPTDDPVESDGRGAVWVPTGEPRVDDAVERLDDLAGLPVDEHVAVFDEVQRRLHDALAGLVPDA